MSKQIREGYKMTELGVIPVDWNIKKISEVAEIVSGGTPSTNNPEYWDNGTILWATPTDITSNKKYISITEKSISKEGLRNSSANLLPMGSILMTSRATIGEKCINTVPMATNQGFKSLICKEDFYNEFMYYLIDAIKDRLISLASGSTFLEISKSAISDFKIIAPPINEQQKIASILSTIDEHIEQVDGLIEKTKELKKGLIQRLLTKGIGHTEFKMTEIGKIPEEWEVKKLKDCVIKIVGGGTPSRNNSDYYEGEIPWATVKDLNDTLFKEDTQEHITEDAIKQSATNLIPENKLIVATRMGLGRCFINTTPMAINQDLKALFPVDTVDTIYLLYWYLSQAIYIESLGSGSTVKGIRLEVLNDLFVPIPSLLEQQKIASILLEVDKHIEKYDIKRQKLLNLKKGLMQKLLIGKLRAC